MLIFFFFFSMKRKAKFRWNVDRDFSRGWSLIEALNIKAERRKCGPICRGNRVESPSASSPFFIFQFYLYRRSYIYILRFIDSFELDPFKSRSNFFSFINFVSAMREGEEKSCFIQFEDCTKTLHKIRTGRCNFSKEVFEPNLTFCIES